MYRKYIKRLLDFLIAVFAFIALSPVFVIATLILLLSNKGKPFFTQPRPGKDQKIFQVIKFKTMSDQRDQQGRLLPDRQRLTKVGKFIRSTSLDEIPQLLNVIKGEMSLVGPRPLLVKYLSRYNENQRKRHNVKPGITGWAQVNGRNAISWEQRFQHDIFYSENYSFTLDMKILFLTVLKVIKREGISSSSSVTMEEFKG